MRLKNWEGEIKRQKSRGEEILCIKVILFFALTFLFSATVFAQPPSPALLNHLQGKWEMSGTLLKNPVRYSAEGTWILQNGFLSFHMTDAAVPPAYEADLFIGIDSAKSEYVAHWLDIYGGAGARVAGIGPYSAEKIEIVYPYAEGKFRNMFTYDTKKDEWSLLIESESKEGKWSTFAKYTTTRVK